MDHAELTRRIVTAASQRGLLTHYCGSARRCTGNPGLPDLLIAGPGGQLWAECKTGGQLDPGQAGWRDVLEAGGARWVRFDPADLWTGRVDKELDRIAG
jgi:hypothetical protein